MTRTGVENSENFNKFYELLYRLYLSDKGFKYDKSDNEIVRLPNGLTIRIFEPYSFVLDEIFLMKVYGEPRLQGKTVVDVGASIADSSLYFATLGAEKVYGFELNKDRYSIALENIRRNNMDTKIRIFNQAATCGSLKELIERENLENIFFKVDCEGCEYEILENADNNFFQCITNVVLEFHGYFKPLVQKLEKFGFNVEKKGRMIYAKKI